MLLESFPVPMDKHLRTGADKGKPTVPIKNKALATVSTAVDTM